METCRQDTDHKRADKLMSKKQQYASLWSLSVVPSVKSNVLNPQPVFICFYTNCRHLDTEIVKRLEQNSGKFTLDNSCCSDGPWWFPNTGSPSQNVPSFYPGMFHTTWHPSSKQGLGFHLWPHSVQTATIFLNQWKLENFFFNPYTGCSKSS